MKFAAIAEYRHLWPLSWMCEVFQVTRAGFYEWLKRPPSARERLDIDQTVLIRASFADSDQTYGARGEIFAPGVIGAGYIGLSV